LYLINYQRIFKIVDINWCKVFCHNVDLCLGEGPAPKDKGTRLFAPWVVLVVNGAKGSLDDCSQFHQHFTSSFCADILLTNNYKDKLKVEKSCIKHFSSNSCCLNVGEIWHLDIFYAKILAPKNFKPKHSFVFFGAKILYKKCAHIRLMKLNPVVSFINILRQYSVAKNYKAKLYIIREMQSTYVPKKHYT